jgi:hypothetical protein
VWNSQKKRSEVRILHNSGRAEEPKTAERLRNLARSTLKKCDPEEMVPHSASGAISPSAATILNLSFVQNKVCDYKSLKVKMIIFS